MAQKCVVDKMGTFPNLPKLTTASYGNQKGFMLL